MTNEQRDQIIKQLEELGAERLKAEDREGRTRSGWWLDGVWLAPVNDPKGALLQINGN